MFAEKKMLLISVQWPAMRLFYFKQKYIYIMLEQWDNIIISYCT